MLPAYQFVPGQSAQRQMPVQRSGPSQIRQPLPSQRAFFGQRAQRLGRGRAIDRGRAFQMIEEEHEEEETQVVGGDVVAGIISVHYFPARVLFDSGATHSFLSSAFVIRHSIPSTELSNYWNINTGNGMIQITHECRDSPVELCSRVFVAHFLVFGSVTYDAILGMDWLSTFHAHIDCQR